jgi:hypothetical protein
VPGAINAFTAADIKTAGIDRPQDFVALAEHRLVQTQNQGTSFVTARAFHRRATTKPSVAVLIDGVQMATPRSSTGLFDIDTIQVRKGHRARSTDGMPSAARLSSTRKAERCVRRQCDVRIDSGRHQRSQRPERPDLRHAQTIASASFRTRAISGMSIWTRTPIVSRRVRAPAIGVGAVEQLSADVRVYASRVDTQALSSTSRRA